MKQAFKNWMKTGVDLAWRVRCRACRPKCRVCGEPTGMQGAYGRLFAVCQTCGFTFCGDFPQIVANRGMGMVGSWGGPESGGEREDFLVRELSRLTGARKFLLYGVGSAVAFKVLVDEGFDVYGCDVAQDVVQYRSRQYPGRFFDSRQLSEHQGTFDAVIACEVFEHFNRPREDVIAVTDVLKPGGILAGTTDFKLQESVEDGYRVGYMSFRGHVAYWTEAGLRRVVESVGMKLMLFKMICPGSVRPDPKFNQLFYNKRVFVATADKGRFDVLLNLMAKSDTLPLDVPNYAHPAYRRAAA